MVGRVDEKEKVEEKGEVIWVREEEGREVKWREGRVWDRQSA